ncbi:MAG TPA: ATP-dependent zinc metalloprotease FtsH [Ktedonobacteraceae bacterium]|nr:ATP-dependent zinc metalloprotease FtsH [Ktedonobacteraceae bacterium]
MDGKERRDHLSEHGRRPHTFNKTGKKLTPSQIFKFLKTHKQAFFAGILLTAIVMLLFGVFSQFQAPATSVPPGGVTSVDYSTFVSQVKAGNVLAVTIRGDEVNGLLTRSLAQEQGAASNQVAITPAQRTADLATWNRYISASNTSSWANASAAPSIDPARLIYTHIPSSGDPSLMPLLNSDNVVVTTQALATTPAWLSLLWRFAPFLLLVLIMALVLAPRNGARSARTMDDRISQIGKSRVRRFERAKETSQPRRTPEKSPGLGRPATPPTNATLPAKVAPPPVTFNDVAGIDEVRAEVEEIVQFLRSSDRYDRLGARIPRGALLVGPPGTGKTLLAKAVAGEAGVPFFSMSASEFVEMFVGVGASRVRDLFNQARQSAPCVVFIDEIDAVGRKRSMRFAGNDERDQTLNQLLVELDGFNARQAVVVLAATNRVDILDKALLRPGRFDRHINIALPDRAGRQAILAVHTRRTPLHEEVSLERIARLTTGMSGADLANLVNEAALCAARRNLEHITHECFEDALIRVQLGALRPLVMSEAERRIIAFHEGGHALVAYHLPEADTVNRVTILPRGQSLGVTQFTAEEDRYNYSREFLMARIAVGLGGRVSEELTFGPERVTTGAENDLQVVTDLARRMVTRWGMSEKVGVVFSDYSAGGAGLNMSRTDIDDLPVKPRSLVADSDGNLLLDGREQQARQHYAFAMAAPGTGNASSATMATMVDLEVQRILNEGREMARDILREHCDQLTRLADTLMEKEQLNRKEFEALLREENAQ